MAYKDKIVLVTGAGDGVGRNIALHYADLKACVVVTDLNERTGRETVDLIYDKGYSAIYIKADVTDEAEVKKLVETIIHCYGRIDVLINSVGEKYHKDILDLKVEEWEHLIDVNLKSVFLCSREVARYMKTGGSGKIVNIASSKGFMIQASMEAYAAAKGAIVSFTQSLALSLQGFNIQVNCISPGYINNGECKRLRTLANQNLMNLGKCSSDDVAKACVYLTKEDNEYVNGSNLTIDKGLIRKLVHIE